MGILETRIGRFAKLHFQKFWNTFVRTKLPWVDAFPEEYWKSRQIGEPHGPHQYLELQTGSYALLGEVVRLASGPEAPILDMGCNVGRHLNALHKCGFTNLHGVDVQKAAIELMGQVFPEMAAKAHVEQGTFRNYLCKTPGRFFEVVFTYGATVELIPPDFSVCQHMARIASRAVIMVISEDDHSSPRYWQIEFLRAGFWLTRRERPVHAGSGASLLVFRRIFS